MSKTYLIVPDQHAHFEHNNDRADWLGQLLIDLRPDVVVNMGDAADMPSLSSYDKGKRSFQGKSYKKDIEAHLDFQDRMWSPIRQTKKRMPYRVVLEGNHENRVERVLDLSQELTGTIGFSDYAFSDYYHDVVRYDGGLPGIFESDGVLFAHFFPTGISGRPMGGISPARMLAQKNKVSCIAAHSHTLDFASERNVSNKTINTLVCGHFSDYIPDWAGPIGRFWQAGVAVLRNVSDGDFDFQWISLKSLQDIYGTKEVKIVEPI